MWHFVTVCKIYTTGIRKQRRKMASVVVQKVSRQFFKSSSQTVIYPFRNFLGHLLKLIDLLSANSSKFAYHRMEIMKNHSSPSKRINFIVLSSFFRFGSIKIRTAFARPISTKVFAHVKKNFVYDFIIFS